MSLVFDIIILAVCVMSIALGAKRGFIKSVMGVCTLIAALCLAGASSPSDAGSCCAVALSHGGISAPVHTTYHAV